MYFNTLLPAPIARELHRAFNAPNGTTHFGSQVRSEVLERSNAWQLVLDLPGLSREDLEILIENDELVIKGTRQREVLAENERVLQSSRFYGAFEKRWRLSEEIDRGQIAARMDKGVLRIELPKAAQALPQKVEIRIE
jgi:HSP20 family protein